MAYVEHGMWEVLDVLRRHARGESKAQIEAVTGRSRKTVGRYIDAAVELGWRPEVGEPEEALAAKVVVRLRPGNKGSGRSPRESLLFPHKQRIAAWLEGADGERGLKLTKVHRLLQREGIDVHYHALYRFVREHCGFGRVSATVRVASCAPGELAEVDFGRLGYVNDEDGKRRRIYALIVTLGHSRHQYVHITRTQKVEDLIAGIELAWEFFGGVTERVIIDNLKPAVIKPDRYDPTFQRTFDEYARHRGFIIDAAVPRHPKGKPHVERNVQYVRESFFRGETWLNFEQVQREAIVWCRSVAGTRNHGALQRAPLVIFEESERAALKPLSKGRFDVPAWAECTVHPDHHVQFKKAFYSVPTAYVGKAVTVRGDSKLVRIYHKAQLIKTHPRKPAGEWSTDYADYPLEKSAYAMRDPNRIKAQAMTLGENIGRFAELLLSGSVPWAKLRQAQKLLRLVERYGRGRLDAACQRAVAFDLINVKRVERIVVAALDSATPAHPSSAKVVPLPARFLRPAGSFTHPQEKMENVDGPQTFTQNGAQAPQTIGHPCDATGPRGLCEEGESIARGVSGTVPSGRDRPT